MNDNTGLISVFTTNNIAMYGMAKSILDNYGIEYFAPGDNLLNLGDASVNKAEIKVFRKDEELARSLMSTLQEGRHSSKTINGYVAIAIIITSVALLVGIYLVIKGLNL